MSNKAASADTPAPGANDTHRVTGLPGAGVFEEILNTFTSARATLSNLLDLASLETRRAGIALMWMVAWGVITGICIVTAWLGLMVVLAMWAISLGAPPVLAGIAFIILNLVMAAILTYMCINKSRDLKFSATRRQIAGVSPIAPTTS